MKLRNEQFIMQCNNQNSCELIEPKKINVSIIDIIKHLGNEVKKEEVKTYPAFMGTDQYFDQF